MTVAPTAPGRRFVFIDLYRSAVILLMLEGHTFRTLLPAGIQQHSLFQFHEFFHGLSAPAFLFGAGLTFVISTRRRWKEYHHWDAPLARRVKRLLMVILLGLAMHLPYFSFRKILIDGTTAEYLQLFQFDVLHTIGFGLLALHALVFFFRAETRFYGLVLMSIVSVCVLTPLVWDIDFLRFTPPLIAQMFNGLHGSPFPLFPYVGFLFAGVIVSWEFLVAVEHHREPEFMLRLAFLGAVLIGLGVALDLLPIQLYPTYNYWFTSPNYFLVRVGSLMVVTALFWLLGRPLRQPHTALTVFGRESLFVYVLHLVVLYGSAVNPQANIRSVLGTEMSFGHAALVFLLFTLAMYAAALLWSALKRRQVHLYRMIQLAGSGVFLYFFFTRDF